MARQTVQTVNTVTHGGTPMVYESVRDTVYKPVTFPVLVNTSANNSTVNIYLKKKRRIQRTTDYGSEDTRQYEAATGDLIDSIAQHLHVALPQADDTRSSYDTIDIKKPTDYAAKTLVKTRRQPTGDNTNGQRH